MRWKVCLALGGLFLLLGPQISATEWKLPVPKDMATLNKEDLKGVLIPWGTTTYQAREFGLLETADGKVAMAWLRGYDEDGQPIRVTREIRDAIPLGILAMSTLRLGSDANGFLVVGKRTEGEMAPPIYPCGMSHSQGCIPDRCRTKECGEPPGCECSVPGGCDTIARHWCDGECEGNLRCNTMVKDCRCVEREPVPSGGQTPAGGQRPQKEGHEKTAPSRKE